MLGVSVLLGLESSVLLGLECEFLSELEGECFIRAEYFIRTRV